MAYRFEDLASFTKEEARLWNWFCRVGPAREEWSLWVADILGHLVQYPDGIQLRLIQSHTLDANFGEKNLSFGAKSELLIGRDAENDVVLPAKAISKRHARVTVVDNHAYLEDLGGRLGTQLWDKRLEAQEPHMLIDGDQFSIFPYRFRVVLERAWRPEKAVRLDKCHIQLLQRREFLGGSPLGWKLLVLNAHPSGETVLLGVDPFFLAELRKRLLAPLGLSGADAGVPSDGAMSGFILLALLERLNRRLKFPTQFSLSRGESKSSTNPSRGVVASAAVAVGGLSSQFRVFFPLDLLEKCMPEGGGSETLYPDGLSWAFPVSSAFVELAPEVIEQVGPGDILVTESRTEILFPNDFDRGWGASEDPSNKASFRIDKYFERSAEVEAVEGTEATAATPDLATLPVRLHVIVGQKEFTAAEIGCLTPGTIVELHAEKSDPVRLMVNGKILGEGELVEVDGKMAVKVLGWRRA
jgi:flagellar motor switch/type III secretory pathway protein FliN